jgi:hypothetical protein
MYARRYPHKVISLGLLAVGWLYAINFQAHYYTPLSVAKIRLISVIPRNFCRPASTVLAQFPLFIPLILVGRILRDGV